MPVSDIGAQDRAGEAQGGSSAVDALDAVIDEFDEYYRWMDNAHQGKLNDQGIDVRKRIVQVRLVLQLLNAALAESRTIDELADNAANAVGGAHDPWAPLKARAAAFEPHDKRQRELMELIELYSETFYWVAERAIKAANALPGLKSLSAPGVRDARNHLIEHPEGKASRVFNGGFGYGKPRGPVLAAARTDETPAVWPNAGVFVNADEFSNRYVKALRAARATTGV